MINSTQYVNTVHASSNKSDSDKVRFNMKYSINYGTNY